MEPIGQFGSRLLGGKDSAQTRYIYTKPCQVTRILFDNRDDSVLNMLEDDGKLIEPDHYVPIIPIILVNGSEGIGTGFSCYVPPHNPEDIKQNIFRLMNGKSLVKMSPWFRGFKGTIKQTDDNTWLSEGVWTISGNCIHITELPPGRWTQDYKEYLDGMVDKGEITSFVNNSTTDYVNFEVSGYTGQDITNDFKLHKNIRTSNMHLFHPTHGIKKYATAEEILADFIELRMVLYNKRKCHMISILTEQTQILSDKSRFIQMVVDENIIIFRRKRDSIESELERLSFKKIGGNYDYLLDIKTYQYTDEAINRMNKEVHNKQSELTILRKTSFKQMWQNDLESLKV